MAIAPLCFLSPDRRLTRSPVEVGEAEAAVCATEGMNGGMLSVEKTPRGIYPVPLEQRSVQPFPGYES